MTNKDAIKNYYAAMTEALANSDEKAFAQAMEAYGNELQQQIINEAKRYQADADSGILASRGVRQLTSQERTYWNSMIEAMKSSDPKQSVSNLDLTIPETIMEAVFEEITEAHPLLDAIDLQYTPGTVKMIVNTSERPLAAWGALNSQITKELSAGIAAIETGTNKLTAFIPVAQDMLELGAAWIDRYVRTILAEAIACSLEQGAVAGTGKNQPIGMIKDVSATASVVDGVYPNKSAVDLTELSPAGLGAILAELAVNSRGISRVVSGVILVCNPADYWSKIFPAVTPKAADGTYRNDVLPYPMQIIQTPAISVNKVAIGMGKKYKMFVSGAGRNGRIEYSDDYRFLEDERTYKVKTFANGRAYDDKDFIYCDITNLRSVVFPVSIAERATLGVLALSAAASATTTGKTAITVSTDKLDSSNTYKYKVGAASLPIAGTTPTGYTNWNGSDEITAAAGVIVAIVEVDTAGKVVAAGYVESVPKAASNG